MHPRTRRGIAPRLNAENVSESRHGKMGVKLLTGRVIDVAMIPSHE